MNALDYSDLVVYNNCYAISCHYK